jgi:hypothetical protein
MRRNKNLPCIFLPLPTAGGYSPMTSKQACCAHIVNGSTAGGYCLASDAKHTFTTRHGPRRHMCTNLAPSHPHQSDLSSQAE